jgi:hypothetical protein
MKASDLRIGNILRGLNGSSCRVLKLEKDNIIVDYGNLITNKPKPEPIPLTEEWLIKLGFVLDEYEWYNFGEISIKLNEIRCVQKNALDCFNQLPFPNHVHQLQNLYFALKGEELTIKY